MLKHWGCALLKLIVETMAIATVLPTRSAGLGSLATSVASSLTKMGDGLVALRTRK